MVIVKGWTIEERLVIVYFLSRGFSRDGVVKLLKEKIGRYHSTYPLKTLLESIITGHVQQKRVRYGARREGQEWELDAADRIIKQFRKILPSGVADGLMEIRGENEKSILEGEDDPAKIRENLVDFRTRVRIGSRRAEHELEPQNKPSHEAKGRGGVGSHGPEHYQPYVRNAVYETLAPRMVFDPAREQLQATHPPDPAGAPAIAEGDAPNLGPVDPVGRPGSASTIPTISPFAPGQPGGPPIITWDPTLLGTNFGGSKGTFYDQHPSFSRSRSGDRSREGGEERSNERDQLHVRFALPKSPAPRMVFDPAREQLRATHPPDPAGVPAIAEGYAPNLGPVDPVGRPEPASTAPAISPFAPGQPGGPPIITWDPALLGTNFGGSKGTFYDQHPSLSSKKEG